MKSLFNSCRIRLSFVALLAGAASAHAAEPLRIGVPVGLSGANSVVAPVVDHFMQDRKAKTFFLVGSDYAFGRGMLKFTREYIEKQGGRVVGEEYLPIDGSDWTPVVSKIRSANPDALISSTAGGGPNVSLAKQVKAAGLAMPYGNLAIDEGTAKTMGDTAVGLYM